MIQLDVMMFHNINDIPQITIRGLIRRSAAIFQCAITHGVKRKEMASQSALNLVAGTARAAP